MTQVTEAVRAKPSQTVPSDIKPAATYLDGEAVWEKSLRDAHAAEARHEAELRLKSTQLAERQEKQRAELERKVKPRQALQPPGDWRTGMVLPTDEGYIRPLRQPGYRPAGQQWLAKEQAELRARTMQEVAAKKPRLSTLESIKLALANSKPVEHKAGPDREVSATKPKPEQDEEPKPREDEQAKLDTENLWNVEQTAQRAALEHQESLRKRSEECERRMSIADAVCRQTAVRFMSERSTNPFAPILMDIITMYTDALDEESGQHLNSFVPALPRHDRLTNMSLIEWLAFERTDRYSSWLEDRAICNLVLSVPNLHTSKGYFMTPDVLGRWVNANISLQECINAVTDSINGTGIDHGFPASDMPNDAKFLVFPFNPTGNHWIAVEMRPSRKTSKGKITIFETMHNEDGLDSAFVNTILPLLARLICERPGLQWADSDWIVRHQPSTQQLDGCDCGPLTVRNCVWLMASLQPTVTPTHEVRQTGYDLRLAGLNQLYKAMFAKPTPSVSTTTQADI